MIGIATFIWAGDMGYFCDDLWATYWKNVTEDRWDAVGSGFRFTLHGATPGMLRLVLHGGFPSLGGTPLFSSLFRIFHEIIHPGNHWVPPFMATPIFHSLDMKCLVNDLWLEDFPGFGCQKKRLPTLCRGYSSQLLTYD